FERARDEPLPLRIVLSPRGVGLCCNYTRQLIEELPHVRRQRRRELLERALDVVSKRRAGERFEERAREIQGAQLRDREASRQSLERLTVHEPPRLPVVSLFVVEQGEAGLLECLQVTANRAGRDVAQRRQLVDRHTGSAR